MKTLKSIFSVILAITLLATAALGHYTSEQQNHSGDYSAVSTITEKSSQWILDRFGHCTSVINLLQTIDRFGCENFVYEEQKYPFLVQAFDLDKFIFEKNFHGMCFEFSAFAKCAVLVWKEAHQRDDVQAYVYDVKKGKDYRHCYNIIIEDRFTWRLCLTTNVTRTANGEKSRGVGILINETPEEDAARYDEKITNIH